MGDIDFKFLASTPLTAKDMLTWLYLDDDLDEDVICGGKFLGRNLMILDEYVIRISCLVKDFDRWANSEEYLFDLRRSSERRDFVKWVKDEIERGGEHE